MINAAQQYRCPAWLYEKHHIDKLSLRQIADISGVDKSTISYNMRKNGLVYRNRFESVKLAHEQGRIEYGKTKGMKGRPITKQQREKMVKGIREKWKGHRTNHGSGYSVIRHPDKGVQILEHRYIMEIYIGRELDPTEDVHHINENKKDNRIVNLHLFKSRNDHSYYHKMKNLGKEVELRYEYK